MEAVEAILGRRSIRKYLPTAVPPALEEKLLQAAMAAPSAGNQQPWHFVVVRERGRLTELSGTSPHAGMLAGAPLGIAVCGRPGGLKHEPFWVQDCAAAVENLLVAAHALGLGAVWLGYHPRADRVEAAGRVLGLPEDLVTLAVIAVGYPDEAKPPAGRFDPARVHRDRW
jgi:nitroreductase